VIKSKKQSVNFMAGLKSIEERDAVRRRAPAPPLPAATPIVTALPASLTVAQQPSRRGKVAITHWVDPAVRKQLARLSIDHDTSQAALVSEALNLLFEKYGQPPIAAPLNESSTLKPTA
jgi:hypothetical protein